MNNLSQVLKGLGPIRLAIVASVMVGIIGFFFYLMSQASHPGMTLLYSHLEPADAAKVAEKIESEGIPLEIKGDGTQLYVPGDKVARIRMEMAADGIPASGIVGYEIFDRSDVLGASSNVFDINHLRALEGELAKSIKSISGVAAARVHLVLPKRELFSREKTEPSASIILKMKGSTRLNPNQVQAIQNLVASAVPGLPAEKIAIIDDKGTLLARNRDNADILQSASSQQEMKAAYENKLAKTVETLLEKTIGEGKVRAEVTADLDFDRITINSEDYNPDGQVVRSTINAVESNNSDESESSQNVSVQNALPDQGQGGGAGQKTSSQSKRNQETINYEISKTTKVHVKETGTTKKLSVAVLVDGTYATGQDGKKAYTPRSKEELETLTNLVKTAIGFNADRGDKVEVINLQFSTPDIPEASEKDSLKQFIPNFDLTHLAELLVLSIVGLLILLMVVRPLLLKMMEGIPGQDGNSNGVSANTLGLGDQMFSDFEGNSIPISGSQGIPISQTSAGMTMGGDNRGSENNSSDSGIDIASIEGKFKTSNINKIGEIIDKHPEEAVSIIRSWMYAQP